VVPVLRDLAGNHRGSGATDDFLVGFGEIARQNCPIAKLDESSDQSAHGVRESDEPGFVPKTARIAITLVTDAKGHTGTFCGASPITRDRQAAVTLFL
jgi:hypothetical protein